jgi:putative membrane protein
MLDNEKEKRGAAALDEQNQFTQELKLADKLALERTVMSADRTMLAGVRTSMALIGFGFTIFNILKYVQEHSPVKVIMRPQTPRNIGSFLLVVGIVPLLFMIIQYSRTLRRLGRKESPFSNPNFQMAVAILLLGIILLATLIGNILLL